MRYNKSALNLMEENKNKILESTDLVSFFNIKIPYIKKEISSHPELENMLDISCPKISQNEASSLFKSDSPIMKNGIEYYLLNQESKGRSQIQEFYLVPHLIFDNEIKEHFLRLDKKTFFLNPNYLEYLFFIKDNNIMNANKKRVTEYLIMALKSSTLRDHPMDYIVFWIKIALTLNESFLNCINIDTIFNKNDKQLLLSKLL